MIYINFWFSAFYTPLARILHFPSSFIWFLCCFFSQKLSKKLQAVLHRNATDSVIWATEADDEKAEFVLFKILLTLLKIRHFEIEFSFEL